MPDKQERITGDYTHLFYLEFLKKKVGMKIAMCHEVLQLGKNNRNWLFLKKNM